MNAQENTMNVDELLGVLDSVRSAVVPFVGSGLVLDAGAPSDARLATLLRERLNLPNQRDGRSSLLSTMADLAPGRLPEAQQAAADVIKGLLLRPTAVLTALVSVPSRRILTTNYDDALERAAAARGLVPVALSGDDPGLLEEPPEHHVHVIHVHGMAARPETIVLPGKSTDDTSQQEPLQTLLRGRMAASPVLYAGFSFADSELALRAITAWLGRNLEQRRPQWLLMPERDLAQRPEFLAGLRSAGVVHAVGFDATLGYADVERAALHLAPRASVDKGVLTWVAPRLVDVSSSDQEQMSARLLHWTLGQDDRQEFVALEQLTGSGRTLVVAGPGMGKSTLLGRLAAQEERGAALGCLGDFSPDASRPELPVARLLRRHDGEPLGLSGLEGKGQLLCLDGLDELTNPSAREAAAGAICLAVERWPQHAWLVSTRPTTVSELLASSGFEKVAIFPDREWASLYLSTRGISDDRRTRASLEEHGLGDVLTVPLFAERIADRLLEGDGQLPEGPLELLVDEQRQAARREADRRDVRPVELFGWLARVAVALELRARTSAPVEDVALVTGRGELDAVERRAMLAEATLLRDVLGEVTFTLRPMQQAVCASTLLKQADPIATLERVAVTDVDGRRSVRGDIDFTLDLFFGGAPPEARSMLRELDEQRWARTVQAHASVAEADAALDVLLAWHEHRDIPFLRWRDGLRSSEEAVDYLVGRWPQIANRRFDMLVRAVAGRRRSARLRALSVLGALNADPRTAGWLLGLLDDDDDTVAARACALAGRLRVTEAQDQLIQQAANRSEERARPALQALLRISDEQELPEIIGAASGAAGLRRAAGLLRERVHDIDLAFSVLAAIPQPDDVWAWLLGRFIDDARDDAWTPLRIGMLVRALDGRPPDGPDVDQIAAVLALHPEAALDAIRVNYIADQPYVHSLVMRCVERGCGAALQAPERETIREALGHHNAEETERSARLDPHHFRNRLVAALDRDGPEIDVSHLIGPIRLIEFEPRHRAALATFVERWWPTAIDTHSVEPDPCASAALWVGAELELELQDARWLQLLDAVLATPKWRRFELAGDRADWWLAKQYHPHLEPELLERMAAVDADGVAALVGITGRRASDALLDAAVQRLAHISDQDGFSGAAGLLAERGAGGARMQRLLDLQLDKAKRLRLDSSLAHNGDGAAQLRLVARWTSETHAAPEGERERPFWHPDAEYPGMQDALQDLVSVCAVADNRKLLSWAATAIGQRATTESFRTLERLADIHPRHRWTLLSTADDLRGRLATQQVLERLPSGLAELSDLVLGPG